MKRPFLDPDQLVLIAEADAEISNLLQQELNKRGFTKVYAVQSCQSAIKTLEIDQPGWVICAANVNEQPTALHILELLSKYKIFSETRVSFLVTADMMDCLPMAFELGLLSWHEKPMTAESLSTDFNALFRILNETNYNDSLASAYFISRYLERVGNKEDLLLLYQNLFALFPDIPEALFGLFKALVLNNETKEAKKLVGRARLLEYPGWEEAAKTVFAENEVVKPELGVNAVVVAVPDEALRVRIQDLLSRVTDARIYAFSDGKEAYDFCSFHPHVDLVVAEWKLPDMSGPQFVQRLRQEMPPSLPIIVLGLKVPDEDQVLMEEIGVSGYIEKPLQDKLFVSTLARALQQEHRPTTPRSVERKLLQYLEIGDTDRAQRLASYIAREGKVPEGTKIYARGLIAFYEHNLQNAKTHLSNALQRGGNKVKILNALAMTCEELGDNEGALKYYRSAQELSPRNIARLCKIIELNREAEKLNDAEFYIKAAAKIDPDNAALTAEELKLALKLRNTKRLLETLRKRILSESQLVAITNQMGVKLVRQGKFNAAASLYVTCLQVLSKKQTLLRTRILYNLALAHVRHGDYQSALTALSSDSSLIKSALSPRVLSLRNAIRTAMQSGTVISFKGSNTQKQAKEDNFEEIETGPSAGERKTIKLELSNANVGDIGCYKIYSSSSAIPPKWEDALREKIRFNPMVGIFR